MAVAMKNTVLWNVAPCSLVDGYQGSGHISAAIAFPETSVVFRHNKRHRVSMSQEADPAVSVPP
jgi:hypothetical protein